MKIDKITEKSGKENSQAVSQYLRRRLKGLLDPLLVRLFLKMDKRLVKTMEELTAVIIRHRHNANGLLLTELGGELLSPEQAPAGTKRIGNLLKSTAWEAEDIDEFVEEQGLKQYEHLKEQGQRALAIWDESVVEKPESIASQGLCAVKSSKAKRLLRIKPGYYNPPTGKPVHVPGFQWLGLVLAGMFSGISVLRLRCWTTRGEYAQNKQEMLRQWLGWVKDKLADAWHVFDRGFCGAPWLGELLGLKLKFVLRWKKGYKLLNEKGEEKKAWQIALGKRSKSRRRIWDSHRATEVEVGMVYLPVRHPDYPDEQLYLVVCRQGKGREPWYLLTNVLIKSDAEAWEIIFAYARRWQIETVYRFNKSELAIQSPRNKKWKYRLKLMSMLTLAYIFLLLLCLEDSMENIRKWLLRTWCHRTGKKYKKAKMPLYRIRFALSNLWSAIKKNGDISHPEFSML